MKVVQEIARGQRYTVPVKFVRNGAPVVFRVPPQFNLYSADDEVILSGIATEGDVDGEWLADFTMPADYESLSQLDEEDLRLEVYGKDASRVERSADFNFKLLNSDDDFLPEGLVWFKGKRLIDTLNASAVPTSISVDIQNAAGNSVKTFSNLSPSNVRTVRNATDVPGRYSNTSGLTTSYNFEVNLGIFDLPESSASYLIFYTLNFGDESEDLVHSLYWTNNRVINNMLKTKAYLDKARLYEIDPTMQWQDNEYYASSYEGLQYINSIPPEASFWKFSDLSTAFDSYLMYATAYHLLNTRYLAEGLTKFEFTGLNTTLNTDGRAEALTYKMEEIKALLDKAETVKKAIIARNGAGTPDATAGGKSGSSNIGVLGVTLNAATNFRGYGRFGAYSSRRFARRGF